jgi:hypothetical protein
VAQGHKYENAAAIPKTDGLPDKAEVPSSKESLSIVAVSVWITLAILLAFSLLTLYCPLVRVFYRFQINYNEGWNVYVTQAAMQHHDLYPVKHVPAPAVNYPFLSFYLVGFVSHLTGDYLWAGRLLSLLALLVSCVLVGLIVKKLTRGWGPALFGGVFCLGLFCARVPNYVAIDDPQMLAHPFFLFGLWLYLGAPPSTLRIAGITSLFVLGGNIKHNLLPAPVSALSDLFTTSLSKAVRFMIFGALFLALSIVVNMLVGGPAFVSRMVAARPYSFEQLRTALLGFYSPLGLPLAISAFWSIWQLHNRQARVICFYFFSSLLIGAAFSGGAGVNANTFFDNLFAMSIIMGACLDSLWKAPIPSLGKGGRWRFLVPVLLYSTVVMEFVPRGLPLSKALSELSLRQRLFRQEVSFLAAQQGPAICETLMLCFDAGKPYTVNPYGLGIAAKMGTGKANTVADRIAEKQYGVIQTEAPATQKPGLRFPDEVLDAIDRYYVEAVKAPDCHIYVPRP